MPSFGKSSLARLDQCDVRLALVMTAAIENSQIDFGIVCGHRGKEDQDRAVAEGKSKTPWPISKHNALPSLAVDVCPYIGGKYAWNDIQAFKDLAAHILATAEAKGIRLRWGGNWKINDAVSAPGKFVDMPHFEIAE